MTRHEAVSDVLVRQIRAFRARRDLTMAELAAECARLGAPHMTMSTIANIERGLTSKRRRRDVSVDELMVLAAALGVAPMLLVVPLGTGDPVEYVPGVALSPADAARWFVGDVGPFLGESA